MTYRILLVEDDAAVRAQWRAELCRDARLQVGAEAGTLAAARRRIGEAAYDLVLLDLGLPDGDGVRLIEASRGLQPVPQVIVLTGLRDEAHIAAALFAGAAGYLLKDQPPATLGQAVLDTLAGGSVLSPAIARHLLGRMRTSPEAIPHATAMCPLTVREHEILRLIACGFRYEDVARTLAISVNTVATHIQHVYRKLEVKSRGAAVAEAVQRGWVAMGPRRGT